MVAQRRRFIAFIAGLILMLLLAGCSIGGSDATPTATTAPTEPTATSTTEASASPTATEASAATPTTAASPTAAASPTSSASPTATIAASPTATAVPESPIGEMAPLDSNQVPNFTLAIKIQATGIGGPGDATIDYQIEQSATDRFHLKANNSGTELELWKIGDDAFIAQAGGGPARQPEGTDTTLFSPATFLQIVPTIPAETNAQDLGTETIDGRTAQHRRVAAETYLQQASFLGGTAVTNPDGVLDVWIDSELQTPLQMQGDLTWTNADGSDGKFAIDYQLTQIGSTPEVQAPAVP